MSIGGSTHSGHRRRSLDAEVNLVPFIDLLSMCICFLLMTAVWLELGSVPIKQLFGTDAPASASKNREIDLKFLSPTTLELAVKGLGGNKTLQIKGTDDTDRDSK